MELIVDPGGQVRCIYDDNLNYSAIGRPSITRASHVEPTSTGAWTADLSPVQGPVLGPFALRSEALNAEQAWLREHWLMPLPISSYSG